MPRPLLVLALATACSTGTTEPTYVAMDLSDLGEACVVDSTEAMGWDLPVDVELEAGGATVLVVFGSCAPACSRAVEASCSARATAGDSGTTIAVEATTTWEAPESLEGIACTDDCQEWAARCPVAIEEGPYTLEYGGQTASFTVPLDGPSPCTAGTGG